MITSVITKRSYYRSLSAGDKDDIESKLYRDVVVLLLFVAGSLNQGYVWQLLHSSMLQALCGD